MDIFGKEWKDHVKKIEKNWNKMISSGDTVVLAGDHSWGRNLKEAEADLEFIASLRSVYKELHADHETGAADNK